jgi:transposase-like protein
MQTHSTKQRYTSDEREQYVKLWRKSGLTQSAFCRKFSLSYQNFGNWVRKSHQQPTKLLPVLADNSISHNASSAQSMSATHHVATVELVFPSGIRCQFKYNSAKEIISFIQEYERCS